MIEGYVEYCNSQDEILEKTDIYGVLSNILNKVEKIEQKVGPDSRYYSYLCRASTSLMVSGPLCPKD